MIKRVIFRNQTDDVLEIDMKNPVKSGFLLTSIDGLGPAKSDIIISEMAMADGGVDNFARLTTRNIVLSFTFFPFPTIEDTRYLSYKYFPTKEKVTMYVETDDRFVRTEGRVESNTPDIFSKSEGCQVSILCADPFFYNADGEQETLFYGTKPLFTFPFSNESLSEKLIEFGEIRLKHEDTIIYTGDSPVGFQIYIRAMGNVTGLEIYDTRTRECLAIDDDALKALLQTGIKKKDQIIISSVVGNKYAILLRDGYVFDIINALKYPIPWFQLDKGTNKFAFKAEHGSSKLEFKIRNKILYLGV